MTLRQRLLSLITLLVVGFGLSIALLHATEKREQRQLADSLRREQAEITQRLIELTARPMQQFVDDYSWWDDMVNFVAQPDPEWARVNLLETIDFFDVDVMWVVDLEGHPRHQTAREDFQQLPLPLEPRPFRQLVGHRRHPTWFAVTGAGVLELRAAPIQPSSTVDHQADPPRGWFVAGRVWHPERLSTLGAALGATTSLLPPDAPPPTPAARGVLRVERELADQRGTPVARLLIERTSPALAIRQATDDNELIVFIAFGALTLLVLALALNRWVLRPLGAIERALRGDEDPTLAALRHDPGEFGRLVRLVEASDAQKHRLAEEIERRQQTAEALQQSETTLRQTIEDRVRLGRDLHDSVIQTLYASGMGIASARRQIAATPADADQRLQTVQDRLNDTIRELRLFITGLEPESAGHATFGQSVQRLVEFICDRERIHAVIDVDDRTADRLTTGHRAQLLQVVREALSNVVRHAEATEVVITLGRETDRAVLTLADNGRGLPVAEPAKLGRGLHNMRDRICSLGGELLIDSTPGKGTRLRVTLGLSPSQQAS